jgi:hypothetical protein
MAESEDAGLTGQVIPKVSMDATDWLFMTEVGVLARIDGSFEDFMGVQGTDGGTSRAERSGRESKILVASRRDMMPFTSSEAMGFAVSAMQFRWVLFAKITANSIRMALVMVFPERSRERRRVSRFSA